MRTLWFSPSVFIFPSLFLRPSGKRNEKVRHPSTLDTRVKETCWLARWHGPPGLVFGERKSDLAVRAHSHGIYGHVLQARSHGTGGGAWSRKQTYTSCISSSVQTRWGQA